LYGSTNPINLLILHPSQSWAPENLYNLWQRVSPDGPLRSETNFTRTSLTLFQQRWRAKRLSRGYHGDHIAEQKFERWYLPDALPSIHGASSTSTPTKTSKSRELGKMVAGRTREGGRAETERTKALLEKKSRTPIGTLLYREVERRLDVLMFRACFATSVWQARQLVVHRKVRVNGVVVSASTSISTRYPDIQSRVFVCADSYGSTFNPSYDR
jgi:ribosomal protein S4